MGFSSHGLWTLEPRATAPQQADSSSTGIEPVSPALAGGFLTTGLLGKPKKILIKHSQKSKLLVRILSALSTLWVFVLNIYDIYRVFMIYMEIKKLI